MGIEHLQQSSRAPYEVTDNATFQAVRKNKAGTGF
jgi:hypothetical protein